jgi:hypothetical protein
MSTKIYTAYRTQHVHDIFALAYELKLKARGEMSKYLEDVYRSIMPHVKMDPKEVERYRKSDPGISDERIRMHLAHNYAREQYKAQLGKFDRNSFDFSASLAIRRLGSRYYIIPYGEYPVIEKVFGFLKRHPKLRYYGYWNNTDPDPKASPREWAERRRVWEKILEHWSNFLCIDVCNWDNFYLIEPSMKMCRAIYRKEKRAQRAAVVGK